MPGGGGWDFADGEDDDDGAKAWEKTDRIAQEIGRGLANDAAIRSQFILEVLVEPQAARAFECGRGLAEGTEDVESLWRELVIAFGMIEPQKCNETLLGGFIFQSNERDAIFTSQALDSAVTNAELLLVLPYLQRQVGINIEGIARLRRAIALGNITASSFNSIANGSVSDSPSEPLATLIKDIQSLPDGIAVALEILSMHFLCNNKDKGVQPTEGLIAVGRDILTQLRFHEVCDYSAHIVIGVCLVGEEAKGAAETVCANIRAALENYSVWSHDLNYSLATLFEAQPLVALDTFLQHSQSHYYCDLFDVSMGRKNPLDNLDPAILRQWAGSNSDVHYPLLGKCIKMFNNEGNDINPLFLLMLEDAPDKRLFLGSKSAHLHPQSGGGSLADILIGRKAQLMKFAEHPDADVRSWVADSIPELEQWIEHERGRDRLSEESFE